MREMLTRLGEVYAKLMPIERKELFRLLVHRAQVSESRMVLEIKTGAGGVEGQAPDTGGERYNSPDWLPERGEDPNFFHFDRICILELRLEIVPGPIFSSRGRGPDDVCESRPYGHPWGEAAPQSHRVGPRMGVPPPERNVRLPSGSRPVARRVPRPSHPSAEPTDPPIARSRCDRRAWGSHPPGTHHRATPSATHEGTTRRNGTGS
jgi:hypothetical protein